jgi:hypothetical protein
MFIPRDKEEILERLKLRKILLSSSSAEGGFCSWETKRDRRKVPKPLFRRTDQRNISISTKNVSWVRVLMRMIYVVVINVNNNEH